MTGNDRRTDEIQIRRFDRDDVDEVVKLWVELVDEHHKLDSRYKLTKNATEHYRMFLLESLYRPERIIFIAARSDSFAGFITGGIMEPSTIYEMGQNAVIQDIFVRPEYRRCKIGSRLVNEALKFFGNHDIHSVQLDVWARSTASRDFWHKMGFDDSQIRMEREP